MPGQWKQRWRELREGRPGKRFQERYERICKERQGGSGGRRVVQLGVGLLLLITGIVLLLIPGPGVPLVLVGGALVAERSRPMARAMDRCEVIFRKMLRQVKRWSATARNAVLVTAVCLVDDVGTTVGAACATPKMLPVFLLG